MGERRACFTIAALICPATRTVRCRAFLVGCAVAFRANRRMTLPIMDLDSWTLSQSIVVFSVCALVITIAGTRITRVVDQLADRTGLGEATAGAVLLGASRYRPFSWLLPIRFTVVQTWNTRRPRLRT